MIRQQERVVICSRNGETTNQRIHSKTEFIHAMDEARSGVRLAIEDGELERRAFDRSGLAGDGNLESTGRTGVVEHLILSILVILGDGFNLDDFSVRFLEDGNFEGIAAVNARTIEIIASLNGERNTLSADSRGQSIARSSATRSPCTAVRNEGLEKLRNRRLPQVERGTKRISSKLQLDRRIQHTNLSREFRENILVQEQLAKSRPDVTNLARNFAETIYGQIKHFEGMNLTDVGRKCLDFTGIEVKNAQGLELIEGEGLEGGDGTIGHVELRERLELDERHGKAINRVLRQVKNLKTKENAHVIRNGAQSVAYNKSREGGTENGQYWRPMSYHDINIGVIPES